MYGRCPVTGVLLSTQRGVKLLIVEGPDHAGKSTLVQRILDVFPEVKLGVRGTDNRDDLWKVTVSDTHTAMAEAVLGANPPMIWDRLYYSELVYAPAVGDREPMFNVSQQAHCQRTIDALHCPVVLCLPPREVVVNGVLHGGHQMPGVVHHIGEIYDRYVDLMVSDVFPAHTHVYDYTQTDPETNWAWERKTFEAIEEDINDYLEERLDRAWS